MPSSSWPDPYDVYMIAISLWPFPTTMMLILSAFVVAHYRGTRKRYRLALKEFDELQDEVDELRNRIARLEDPTLEHDDASIQAQSTDTDDTR